MPNLLARVSQQELDVSMNETIEKIKTIYEKNQKNSFFSYYFTHYLSGLRFI